MKARKAIFPKDHKQTESLVKAGKEAAINAVRRAKALDLPITYIEDGTVYEEQKNGTVIEVKKTAPKKETPFTLAKGMIFHVK